MYIYNEWVRERMRKEANPKLTFGEGFLSGSFGLQAWNHLLFSSCFYFPFQLFSPFLVNFCFFAYLMLIFSLINTHNHPDIFHRYTLGSNKNVDLTEFFFLLFDKEIKSNLDFVLCYKKSVNLPFECIFFKNNITAISTLGM